MINVKCFLTGFVGLMGQGQSSLSRMSTLLHTVDVSTKKATFAMGCFWGPESLYGALQGVIRTRVGYAGGSKVNPTYHNLGDHTESIDIDFDPNVVTYNQLLDVFWINHDPTSKSSVQYTSLIFYHDEEQKNLAEKSLKEQDQKKKSGYFVTKVIPFKEFYNAEDYHQKYRLQQHSYLKKAIGLKPEHLITSHVAARLNGYVVGIGGVKQFNKEVSRLGLNDEIADYVRKYVIKYEGHGLTC